jgi:hypothetical protein
MSFNELVVSTDAEGNHEIENIEWDTNLKITLTDGTQQIGTQAGTLASSTFFLVNKSPNRFGIVALYCTDPRIKVGYLESWVISGGALKVTLTYKVPENPSKKDVIKGAKIILQGYFMIEG